MTYPEAPWHLQGQALLTLNLVAYETARSLIPGELQLIAVLPGQTLGGVYLAQYGMGSVLQYNELIVVPGLVTYGGKVGAWVSHIYVDHPEAIAGGREIWGLPKEMAAFAWQEDGQTQVTVQQGNQRLCQMTCSKPFSLWQQPISGISFSCLGSNLLQFTATAKLQLGLTGANLQIPPGSPFAGLHLGQPWLTIAGKNLHLSVDAPSIIGPYQPPASSVPGRV